MTGKPVFFYWLLKHAISKFTPFPAQSVKLHLVLYHSLCSTSVTYETTCHAIGHQVLPTQPLPREMEAFPRGGSYPKNVPRPTYLASLQPESIT